MSVSDWQTFPVLRTTYSRRVTSDVGKTSAIGQPTRPTQPFILSWSVNKAATRCLPLLGALVVTLWTCYGAL